MLYHADVFMPRRIRNMVPQHELEILYSSHALNAAKSDRYGTLTLPKKIYGATLIEAEVYGGQLHKMVVRLALSDNLDLCLALIPLKNKQALCKTVWANEKNDNHATLNRHSYVQG